MKRLSIITIVIFALLAWVMPVLGQAPASGGVVIATSFPSIVADKGQTLTFPLDVVNDGADWQNLELKVDGPADWAPAFKQAGATVRRVMVGPAKAQSLELQVRPPETATAQDYTFVVQGVGADGKPASELRIVVSLQEKIARTGLRAEAQYTDNRGQPGNTFSFRTTVYNDADVDRPINFAAQSPSDWDVTYKAGSELRQVTSFVVKAASSVDVTIDIVTPQRAEAGDYNVVFRLSADKDSAEIPFRIGIIGKEGLRLTTISGQLNANATIDQETKITLAIENTGSAPLQNVTLTSSSPEGWDVTFSPEKVELLPVGQTAQVTASLVPSNQVLAGDYMLSMSAAATQVSDSKDIRVTVETPTTWGIAAVIAIVVVLGGLALIFVRFSRR